MIDWVFLLSSLYIAFDQIENKIFKQILIFDIYFKNLR